MHTQIPSMTDYGFTQEAKNGLLPSIIETKIPVEIRLYLFISELYKEIKEVTPEDGFSYPRDLTLVTEINKKSAIFEHLQNAMRVLNAGFDIKEP